MRNLIAATLLAAATTGAQAAPPPPSVQAVRQAVAAELRDPGAAQFRDVRVVASTEAGANACGEVNAKNGYGGFIGWQPFFAEMIAVGKTWKAVVWTADRMGTATVLAKCRAG